MMYTEILTIAQIIESFFTVAAIIVGAFWTYRIFIKNRKDLPKAKIGHEISSRKLDDNRTLLSMDITVNNIGDVLIDLKLMEVHLASLIPFLDKPDYLIEKDSNLFVGKELEELNVISFVHSGKLAHELEPGESQQFHWNYIIKSEIKVVQLVSFFGNMDKIGKDVIGWRRITVHDIKSLD